MANCSSVIPFVRTAESYLVKQFTWSDHPLEHPDHPLRIGHAVIECYASVLTRENLPLDH